MCYSRITAMHASELTLSLTCLIMHITTDKWGYEYSYDPLFSLTFVGCTVALVAIIILDSFRRNDTWYDDQIEVQYLIRAEIIFGFIAFVMFVVCGVINLIYDDRAEVIVKGVISIINGICFLLDTVVCNPCQFRWFPSQQEQDEIIDERRTFYHLAYQNRYVQI